MAALLFLAGRIVIAPNVNRVELARLYWKAQREMESDLTRRGDMYVILLFEIFGLLSLYFKQGAAERCKL